MKPSVFNYADYEQLQQKYTQAMELLGLAVKEFHQYKFMDVCVICDNCISCSCLPWRNCNGVNFRWKHADKLEELRGGKAHDL